MPRNIYFEEDSRPLHVSIGKFNVYYASCARAKSSVEKKIIRRVHFISQKFILSWKTITPLNLIIMLF